MRIIIAMATRLDPALVPVLRDRLPEVAGDTIRTVMAEVPAYAVPFDGPMGLTIEQAVQMALAGFLRHATKPGAETDSIGQSPEFEAAYALGRGEARSGRSVDALLSAFRVGARCAWRELAATAVEHGADAHTLATFAELVFAYIDELSAASVAGHTDELETSGRLKQRYLERLALTLLRGEADDVVEEAAARADWSAPRSLTAVVLPASQVRPFVGAVEGAALVVTDGAPGLPEGRAAVLVAGYGGRARRRLLALLSGRSAVVGPHRPWREVRTSYARALRGVALLTDIAGGASTREPGHDAALDTESVLPTLVLNADPEALADLRARALAPLDEVRETSREKLVETLRAWLLHQGRRDDIAAALFVHPQTVRYRMGQLRELFGDRLEDPDVIRDLTLALA